MTEILSTVLPFTLKASLIAIVIIYFFTKDDKAGGFLILIGCSIVWGLLRVGCGWIQEFGESFTPPFSAKPLYPLGMAAGQLYLLVIIASVIYDIRNPPSEHHYSNSMDDKRRLYDADGNVVGYMDND